MHFLDIPQHEEKRFRVCASHWVANSYEWILSEILNYEKWFAVSADNLTASAS